jgi:hypothetical protein
MSLKDFVGEFLSFLELQEARLLSWGFYDFSYTTNDVEELFNDYADDELKNAWETIENDGMTMDELVYEMEQAGLLYRPDDNEDSYRTRFAEGIRLFAHLRQMFKEKDWATGANLVSDIKLHLAPRRYPFRDQTAADCWSDLKPLCWNESLQKDAFDALTANHNGDSYTFARFQRDSFARVLKHYKGINLSGTVVSAGTGAGKTKAFYLPALLGAVTEISANLPPFVKIIAVYPRNVLLADQLREALSEAAKLSSVLAKHKLRPLRFGALLGSTPKKDDFTRDAGNGKTSAEKIRNWKRVGNGFIVPFVKSPFDASQDLIWRDEDRERGNTQLFRANGDSTVPDIPNKVLILTREELRQNPPDVLFLSAEMLNRELGNSEWDLVFGINRGEYNPRLLLLDEVHAYEGLHGAQIAWTLRRWRFWSKNVNQHIVGLSATLKEAPKHLGTLVGMSTSSVQQFTPAENELDYKGIEYNLAVKGDPVSGASLLATSIQSAMLVGRLLTPRNAPTGGTNGDEIRQSDFYGRKVFGFTDNLDSLNRWYSDTTDADKNKRLARLRLHPAKRQPPIAVDAALMKRVDEAGQFWELPRRLGFNLNNSLNISRCSSQDPGANAGSDLIVASASLEVGFDDPEVGAVIHHKKPVSMSSFIQRKGRAGRRAGMRPLTIVILSDYGGDRWAFQNAERLFQPEIDNILLPLINPSVLRIQATFFLLEWLARRINLGGSYYNYFSTPYSQEMSWWQKDRIKKAIPILQDFLQQGTHWKAFRQDFTRVFSRPYKNDGHKLGEPELDAILWESPRPVLRHVVPTLLRQFEAEWKLANSVEQLENAGVRHPLPQFLPSATFEELGGIGVRLTFADENGQNNEKADEYLTVSRALSEACPGRVSKRYALKLQESGFWHKFSEQILNEPNPTFTVSVKTLYPNSLFAKEVNGVLVHQPTTIELTHRPENVLDTSNSSWNWQSFLQTRGEGISLSIFQGKVWTDLFDNCKTHLHRAYSKVDVTRLARSCEYEIRFDKGGSTRGMVLLGSSKDKNDEAIGFRLQADGIVVYLNPTKANEAHTLTSEQIARFRPQYYLHALKACPFLYEKMNHFLVEWMWQTSIAMLAATASQKRCSFAEAQDLLVGVRPQAAAKVLDSIFQVRDVALNQEEQEMRLKARIIEQWSDETVIERFTELERILWKDLDDDFMEWIKNRHVATLAQAFRTAAVAGVNDVSEDDIAVDVERDENGAAQIYLTEQNSGGLGQIELVINYLRQSPEKFLEAMRNALTYCPRNVSFQGLSKTLESVVTSNPHQNALVDSLVNVRVAKNFKEQSKAKSDLQNALENTGLRASRSAIVALVTKLLRPGSSTKTDKAMYLLNQLWHRTEQNLGVAIDARVFAYVCSQRTPIRRRTIDLLREIGDSQNPSPAQIHSIIGQFLLHDCEDSCPECLDNPNRFNNFGKPSRSLTRVKLSLDAVEVAVDKNSTEWLDQARQILRDDGRVRIITQNDDVSIVSKVIQGLLAEEIEVEYLLLPISIANITRHADRWFIELQLKGFGYGV